MISKLFLLVLLTNILNLVKVWDPNYYTHDYHINVKFTCNGEEYLTAKVELLTQEDIPGKGSFLVF